MVRTILLILCLFPLLSSAQTIKGTVVDAASEMPLIGASVEVISVDPIRGEVTDLDGHFSLRDLPAGQVEEVRARVVRDQLGLADETPRPQRQRRKP